MRLPRLEPGALVIVHLVNPTEKYWGVLGELSVTGVVLRALNVASFDDWMAQICHGDPGEVTLDLATMFFPLFRVERLFLDETVGSIESYGRRFERRVGRRVEQYLGLETPVDDHQVPS